MDIDAALIASLAATLVAVTISARKLGNEKRDVALLGAISAVLGLGAAVVAAV